MSLPGDLHLSGSFEHLQPILPDRLKHHQAWLLVLLLGLLHQALVDERGYPIERLPPLNTQRFTDCLYCFQCATPDEDGESQEESLLCCI